MHCGTIVEETLDSMHIGPDVWILRCVVIASERGDMLQDVWRIQIMEIKHIVAPSVGKVLDSGCKPRLNVEEAGKSVFNQCSRKIAAVVRPFETVC